MVGLLILIAVLLVFIIILLIVLIGSINGVRSDMKIWFEYEQFGRYKNI